MKRISPQTILILSSNSNSTLHVLDLCARCDITIGKTGKTGSYLYLMYLYWSKTFSLQKPFITFGLTILKVMVAHPVTVPVQWRKWAGGRFCPQRTYFLLLLNLQIVVKCLTNIRKLFNPSISSQSKPSYEVLWVHSNFSSYLICRSWYTHFRPFSMGGNGGLH